MSHAFALLALLAGVAHAGNLPQNRLIVLGRSIGPVQLAERRTTVTRTLGTGKRIRAGEVSYVGGRLFVSYWFHDRIYPRVSYIRTTWAGFHTRSGRHVGMRQADLNLPRGSCSRGICELPAGKGADAPGTGFGVRAGRVIWIAVGYR